MTSSQEKIPLERVVLFDVDGVVVNTPGWTHNVERDCGISQSNLQEFFRADFEACVRGDADLRTALAPWLTRWNYPHGVDAFLKYWFESDAVVDEDVLALARALGGEPGVACMLATNQEAHRARYLMAKDGVGLDTTFLHMHAAHELGACKPSPLFFERMVERVRSFAGSGVRLYFTDDLERNVIEARRHGIESHTFTEAASLASWLTSCGFSLAQRHEPVDFHTATCEPK